MRNIRYERIANMHKADEKRFSNAIIAFISGGVMGAMAEIMIDLFIMWFDIGRKDAATLMILSFIFIACLLTAMGYFDKLVTTFKCGLIIPITGFAHSMMSAALEYKKEGPIFGIGSNTFKLAGSVIVYGVVSAWTFGIIRLLIGGLL